MRMPFGIWAFIATAACAASPPPAAPAVSGPRAEASPEPAPAVEPAAPAREAERAAAVEPRAAEPGVPAEPAPAPAPPPAAPEEGTLIGRSGKLVQLRLGGDALPEPGTRWTLLRHFSGKSGDKTPLGALGGLLGGSVQIGGWLTVADVVVKEVDAGVVTLQVEAERSKMTLNGKPVNHFTPGARIRLAARSD